MPYPPWSGRCRVFHLCQILYITYSYRHTVLKGKISDLSTILILQPHISGIPCHDCNNYYPINNNIWLPLFLPLLCNKSPTAERLVRIDNSVLKFPLAIYIHNEASSSPIRCNSPSLSLSQRAGYTHRVVECSIPNLEKLITRMFSLLLYRETKNN